MAWKEAASTFEAEIKSEDLRSRGLTGYMLHHPAIEQSK